MLRAHQSDKHLQVYPDTELMPHAATRHQTASEPGGVGETRPCLVQVQGES